MLNDLIAIRNVSRAAERLNLTQPATSNSLAKLHRVARSWSSTLYVTTIHECLARFYKKHVWQKVVALKIDFSVIGEHL